MIFRRPRERSDVARPRTFEREEVVEKALGVFWRQGYQATSVQDLVEATGLNRGSLYDTFGDKHGLFLEVVEHYRSHVTAKRLARLEAPGPAREKIATFFKEVIEFSVGEGRLLGCLMTNSAIELAPHDRDTRLAVAANMAAMEATFRRVLTRARKEGEIAAEKSPADLARFLTATANGLRVMAKVAPERAALRSVVRIALESLD
jgi:TetR/AcrR family transcriptional repressor of nem operon